MYFPSLESRLARVQRWCGILVVGGGLVGNAVMIVMTDNYSSVFGHNFDFKTDLLKSRPKLNVRNIRYLTDMYLRLLT